jgi:hypothetical protein
VTIGSETAIRAAGRDLNICALSQYGRKCVKKVSD